MGRLKLKADGRNQELVLAYLEENASEDLVAKINEGTRTLGDCWGYITSRARNKAKGNSVAIEDAEVFGWAVHFFEEDAGDLRKESDAEASAAAQRRTEENKRRAEETARKQKEKEAAEKKLAEEAARIKAQKEKEKAEAAARKAAEAEEKRKKKELEATGAVAGQTTLFDFFGMEG